ncbi:unnamed protein product, partial [Prorocentrum cordatum]
RRRRRRRKSRTNGTPALARPPALRARGAPMSSSPRAALSGPGARCRTRPSPRPFHGRPRCLPSSLIGTQHTLKPIGRRNGEGQGDERAISMGANCGSGTPVANLRTMAPTRGTEQARSHAEALLQQASPRAEPRLVQENRTA